MKRNSLTTALLAGLTGVAGVASVSNAVNVNPDGMGQVLLFPYYTANSNNNTLISIVNTTENGKAVKVRFLEGKNSREVLDFNLYMSPYDVWTAAVTPNAADDGGSLSTTDTSCTVPAINGSVDFVNYQYAEFTTVDNSDGGPEDLNRGREGYIEVIEMGTLDDAAEGTETAITHVAGVPADCAQVVEAWTVNAANDYWIQDPTTDILPPSGGLFGGGAILDPVEGTLFSYNATAIDGFSDTEMHRNPGSREPNLDSGDRNDVIVFNNGVVETATFVDSIDAVSAVLMAAQVSNEWVVDTGFSTEWVVTFPTKWYYVEDTTAANDAIAPFTDEFSSTGACETLNVSIWDREELLADSPIGTGAPIFSPPPPPGAPTTLPSICWEAQVISFNGEAAINGTGTGERTAILGSQNAVNIDLAGYANFTEAKAGWMELDFSADPLHVLTSADAVDFVGLPAVGFMVYEINVTDLATPGGFLANYGGLWNHRVSRDIN